MRSASGGTKSREFCTPRCTAGLTESGSSRLLLLPQQQSAAALIRKLMTSSTAGGIRAATAGVRLCTATCPRLRTYVRSHWMSPGGGVRLDLVGGPRTLVYFLFLENSGESRSTLARVIREELLFCEAPFAQKVANRKPEGGAPSCPRPSGSAQAQPPAPQDLELGTRITLARVDPALLDLKVGASTN